MKNGETMSNTPPTNFSTFAPSVGILVYELSAPLFWNLGLAFTFYEENNMSYLHFAYEWHVKLNKLFAMDAMFMANHTDNT